MVSLILLTHTLILTLTITYNLLLDYNVSTPLELNNEGQIDMHSSNLGFPYFKVDILPFGASAMIVLA